MNPEQCEFLAENEEIQIKPNFNHDKLYLVCGDYGPFEAGMPVTVPLWLAITLKRKFKCEIIPPDWLNVATMKKMYTAETESLTFTSIPKFFFEISHLLIREARDDLEHVDQYESCHARMNNITTLEIAYAKPPVVAATQKIAEYHRTVQDLTPS